MKCQFCNEKVYFFSCTCGSKVFFDLPYYPWHPHERRCYRYLIWYLQEIENTPILEIRSLIERYSEETGIEVSRDVRDYLSHIERQQSSLKPRIINVEPKNEELVILGLVVSVNLQVNFFKRLQLSDNPFGRALLGKLLSLSCVEVKIRQETKEANCFNDYSVFVPTRLYNEEPFRQNSRVFVVIKPYEIVGRGEIWLCSELRVVI